MRSFKLTLAMCALAIIIQAQPFTGQSFYPHGATPGIFSSGTYVGTNPGFIMAGYIPSTAAGSPNFLVDKVDPDGSFASGTGFSREYQVFDAGTYCEASQPTQETNCYGVSIIEGPTATGSSGYALTAAFDGGILFATLGNTGAVISSAFYTIPAGAIPDGKPLITLSSGGDYYVCGSYLLNSIDYVYAFKLTAGGASLWTFIYDLNIATFIPRGIVEDKYPGFPELAITGVLGTSTTDGFFITLNGATGAPIFEEALASGLTVNESLSSIALAASNNGYIMGGSTDMSPGSGRAWMMNLNAGGTINWSRRIDPSTNTTAGEVVGVVERFSSAYQAFEYYGLTVSTGASGGMMVLKLDKNGDPFSQAPNTNNEFVYNDGGGAGTIALPVSISLLDAGAAGVNTGIHVFGTDQNSPPQFFLNQACFNGATGSCNSTSQQNLTMIADTAKGPIVTYTFNSTVSTGLEQCRRHSVPSNTINYAPNQPCSMTTMPTTPYAGDNSRTAAPTGLAENKINNTGVLSVYPNPVNDIAEISYTAAKAGEVTISLSDILGRQIKTLDAGYKNAGVTTLRFDMNSLNLQTGVYLINVSMNGETSQQKLIFTKN